MLFNLGQGTNTFTHWSSDDQPTEYHRQGMDMVVMGPGDPGRMGYHMAVDTSPKDCSPLLSLLLKCEITKGREMEMAESVFNLFVQKTNEYYDKHKEELAEAKDFTPPPKVSCSIPMFFF